MIKTVLLDLDDTILDFHKAEEVAMRNTLLNFGIEPEKEVIELYSQINKRQWERMERGEITRDQVRLGRFELFLQALGNTAPAKEVQAFYEEQLSAGHFFIDGAEELLTRLYKKYDLYIASNGTASVQNRRIRESGITKYFKDIFISENIGHNKPQREFFDYCFERIEGFEKDKTIIIGDSLSSDILGGINAGIKTCRFNPKGAPCNEKIVPDYEIKSLEEIDGLLAGL